MAIEQKNGGLVTGANAVIKLGTVALGMSRDLSYNVSIQHIPVEALGTLEVIANEPISYSVSGSFSIFRYTKNITGEVAVAADMTSGNMLSKYGQLSHTNPAEILFSTTFDINIQQKDNASSSSAKNLINFFKIENCRITNRSAGLDKRGLLVDRYDFVGILAGDVVDGDEGTSIENSTWVQDGTRVAPKP